MEAMIVLLIASVGAAGFLYIYQFSPGAKRSRLLAAFQPMPRLPKEPRLRPLEETDIAAITPMLQTPAVPKLNLAPIPPAIFTKEFRTPLGQRFDGFKPNKIVKAQSRHGRNWPRAHVVEAKASGLVLRRPPHQAEFIRPFSKIRSA